MQQVDVMPIPLERLADSLTPQRALRFRVAADRARRLLAGRTVWNVSSTAHGGGVAEMLQTLLAYGRAAGVDVRWAVIEGDAPFFTVTKRIHNLIHGSPGDGAGLGATERDHYQRVTARSADELRELVGPNDIVLLHDPQTAGLVTPLQDHGAHVVWRCHIGRDAPNEFTDAGWAFLRDLIEGADAMVFSRRQYAPSWATGERLHVIAPSLDPFSAKNRALDIRDVHATLRHAGLIDAEPDHGTVTFTRRDGSHGATRAHRSLILDGDPLPRHARVVLQVSRWDRLKDMSGVLASFAERLDDLHRDAHLLLVGPDVLGVDDDPEGAAVLAECRTQWERLWPAARARTHLCCLPMDDGDENAHLVNALQRYASVVVQKSIAEGFGLTVTEPMWKGRPVVAAAVGGIQDQIVDGVSGRLLADPADLDGFGHLVAEVLADEEEASRLGAAAHERVRDRYLGDRHLEQYGDLFAALVDGE